MTDFASLPLALSLAVQEATLPNWFLFGVPLIGLGLLLVLAVGVVGVWQTLHHVRRVQELCGRLNALESVQASVKSLASEGRDLDLRRIEHVLLEIRAGQKRLDESLLAILESTRSRDVEIVSQPSGPASLSDRLINRLVALGYERIQILTPAAEIAALARTGPADSDRTGPSEVPVEGAIVVEARRYGALCKGRVQVRDGMLGEVELQPSYGSFP